MNVLGRRRLLLAFKFRDAPFKILQRDLNRIHVDRLIPIEDGPPQAGHSLLQSRGWFVRRHRETLLLSLVQCPRIMRRSVRGVGGMCASCPQLREDDAVRDQIERNQDARNERPRQCQHRCRPGAGVNELQRRAIDRGHAEGDCCQPTLTQPALEPFRLVRRGAPARAAH
jgi:hypothetical protein